jgi:hypothetical protein
MALEGTLKDFSLADIFQLIGLQRKTGILTLQSELDTVTITFHQGMVVGAESVEKKLEDRLGRVLVKRGTITEENLERALETQKETLQRLGYVLVKYNFIQPEELRGALLQQIQQIIFRLFRWKEGYYHFRQEKTVHYDRENISPLSAENILMEGVRMIDEWPNIEKLIESFHTVYVPTPKAEKVIVMDVDEEIQLGAGTSSSTAHQITRNQAEVLELLDGKRDVQAVVDASKLLEFDVCKALASLIQKGIVAPLHRKPVEPEIQLAPTHFEGFRMLGRAVALLVCVAVLMIAIPTAVRMVTSLGGSARPLWSQRLDQVRLDRLRYAISVYYLVHQAYPEEISVLVKETYLPEEILTDSQGKELRYSADSQGFTLRAAGRDGRWQTKDDLLVEGSVQTLPDESRFYHRLFPDPALLPPSTPAAVPSPALEQPSS